MGGGIVGYTSRGNAEQEKPSATIIIMASTHLPTPGNPIPGQVSIFNILLAFPGHLLPIIVTVIKQG